MKTNKSLVVGSFHSLDLMIRLEVIFLQMAGNLYTISPLILENYFFPQHVSFNLVFHKLKKTNLRLFWLILNISNLEHKLIYIYDDD